MATLNINADDIQALIQLVQRAAMSRAEALYTEALFNNWLTQLAQPGGASAAGVLPPGAPGMPVIQPREDRYIEQPSQPLPAGAPSTAHSDQVQSI